MLLKKRICPICGTEDKFGVCEKCGWVEDILQEENKDEEGGANIISFNLYKEAYEKEWSKKWNKDEGEA